MDEGQALLLIFRYVDLEPLDGIGGDIVEREREAGRLVAREIERVGGGEDQALDLVTPRVGLGLNIGHHPVGKAELRIARGNARQRVDGVFLERSIFLFAGIGAVAACRRVGATASRGGIVSGAQLALQRPQRGVFERAEVDRIELDFIGFSVCVLQEPLQHVGDRLGQELEHIERDGAIGRLEIIGQQVARDLVDQRGERQRVFELLAEQRCGDHRIKHADLGRNDLDQVLELLDERVASEAESRNADLDDVAIGRAIPGIGAGVAGIVGACVGSGIGAGGIIGTRVGSGIGRIIGACVGTRVGTRIVARSGVGSCVVCG